MAPASEAGVFRGISDIPPTHYLFEIESFSLLSKSGVDMIKTKTFEAGGHRWKMKLFPMGNNGGGGDHISMYLMLESTRSLPAGNAVNAFFKFFLLDQIKGKYLTVEGSVRRFDRIKSEWGIAKFISLKELKVTEGYLVKDTCLFGVEVFVSKGTRVRECLSISKTANISGKYEWKIKKFSKMEETVYSEDFVVGGYKWKIRLVRNSDKNHKASSLSMFLVSVDSKNFTTDHKVKAECVLTLTDQFNRKHLQHKGNIWFGSSVRSWSWDSFIGLKDLKDDKKGYVVSDRCIIEAKVTLLYKTRQKTVKC